MFFTHKVLTCSPGSYGEQSTLFFVLVMVHRNLCTVGNKPAMSTKLKFQCFKGSLQVATVCS